MTHWIIKIKDFIEEHKTAFDISVGGSIGFVPSLIKYWEHFLQEENLFHFYDGLTNTFFNTLMGAAVLWVVHRFIFKAKKK